MEIKLLIDDYISFICGQVVIKKNMIHFKESYSLHCCLDKILGIYDKTFMERFYLKLYTVFTDIQCSICWLE